MAPTPPSDYLTVLWLVLQYMKKDIVNYGFISMKDARQQLNEYIEASNAHDAMYPGLLADNPGMESMYAYPLQVAGELFDLAYAGWETKMMVKNILRRHPVRMLRACYGAVSWTPTTEFIDSKDKMVRMTRPPRQHRSGLKFQK